MNTWARKVYHEYREALIKEFPALAGTTPEYDELRPAEKRIWDKVGAWVDCEIEDAEFMAQLDTEGL